MNGVALVFVGALALGETSASPTWMSDYTAAQDVGIKSKRPLAVFIGKGADGFHHVNRAGNLGSAAEKLLAESYVCVYLDVTSPAAEAYVQAFGFKAGKGLILSDRSGAHQAFYHDGDLSAGELTEALRRHGEAAPISDGKYATFSGANFDAEVLKSSQPVLVDFYADWCGPCQRMGPIVAAVGADFRGRAKVGKINTDQNSALASKYGVSAIPAFLIFRDGEVVDRIVGATSKAELSARVNASLRK
jgi:thioredoxin 1